MLHNLCIKNSPDFIFPQSLTKATQKRKQSKTPSLTEILEYTLQQKRYSQPAPVVYKQRHRNHSLALNIPPRESFSSTANNFPTSPRLSVTNTELFDIELDRRNSRQLNEISRDGKQSRTSTKSNRSMKPSSSQTSLTRSKSLILQTPIKHSPDCKSNPNKF